MITICYGSETGNAESLADMAKTHFEQKNQPVELFALEDISLSDMAQKSHVLIITSTWGDGEPPTNAISFSEELESESELNLSSLQYSILALGDSAYPDFCQFGRDVDDKLAELGAKAIYPRKECDVDFDAEYEEWIEGVTQSMQTALV